MSAQPRPKRALADVLRQVLNDEPSPWAVTLFLWSLAAFVVCTGAAVISTLIEALVA